MEPAIQIYINAFHSFGIALCNYISIFLIFPIILSTNYLCFCLHYYSLSDNSTPTIIFYNKLQYIQCWLPIFFHSSNNFSNQKYILNVFVSIWCKVGRKYLHRFLSSLSRDFRVRIQGIIRNISASEHYTISLNLSYFYDIDYIVPEKCSK